MPLSILCCLCAVKGIPHKLVLEVKNLMCWAMGSHLSGILEEAGGSHSVSSLCQVLAFWLCPKGKSTHIHFLVKCKFYCCLSLPLGLSGVVEIRTSLSRKNWEGKERTLNLFLWRKWQHSRWPTLAVQRYPLGPERRHHAFLLWG